jgi:hypothetical protein
MSTPASAIGMELVYEFEYFARLKPPVEGGAGPYGTRVFFEVIDGEVTGERISGRLLTGGGDWLLVGPDGMGRLDVRAQIETHDNAVLYLTYEGVIEMNERVQTAARAGEGLRDRTSARRRVGRLATGTRGSPRRCSSARGGSTRLERAVPRLPRQLRHWDQQLPRRASLTCQATPLNPQSPHLNGEDDGSAIFVRSRLDRLGISGWDTRLYGRQ